MRSNADIHLLIDRIPLFPTLYNNRIYKYMYVASVLDKFNNFIKLYKLYLSNKKYRLVFSSPWLKSFYRMEKQSLVLPPSNLFTSERVKDNRLIRETININDEYMLYMGWLRPERFPIHPFILLAKRTGIPLLIIGRWTENIYKEKEYMKFIQKIINRYKLNNLVYVLRRELSVPEKLSVIKGSKVVLYPFITDKINPPVVDPPLLVIESLLLNKPVITTPIYSLPWIRSFCSKLIIIPFDYDSLTLSKYIYNMDGINSKCLIKDVFKLYEQKFINLLY